MLQDRGREGLGAISACTLLSQPTLTQHAAALETSGRLRRTRPTTAEVGA